MLLYPSPLVDIVNFLTFQMICGGLRVDMPSLISIYKISLAYKLSPFALRYDLLEAVVITKHANPGGSSHQISIANGSPESSIALANFEDIRNLKMSRERSSRDLEDCTLQSSLLKPKPVYDDRKKSSCELNNDEHFTKDQSCFRFWIQQHPFGWITIHLCIILLYTMCYAFVLSKDFKAMPAPSDPGSNGQPMMYCQYRKLSAVHY